MKFFFLFLVLAVIGVKAKPRAQADASAGGKAQVGGCSVGVGVEATAGGQANADGGCDTSKKYTYTINAKRTEQVVAPAMPVLYMYYQVSKTQNLTYFKKVDDDNPFELEIYLINGDYSYDAGSSDHINACTDPDDGTWDYVAVKVIQGGLMPDGSCPVETGNYDIDQEVDPITVTFPEMMPCGDYDLISNVFQGEVWAIQVTFSFNIPEDDNCLSN